MKHEANLIAKWAWLLMMAAHRLDAYCPTVRILERMLQRCLSNTERLDARIAELICLNAFAGKL